MRPKGYYLKTELTVKEFEKALEISVNKYSTLHENIFVSRL